jgi:hypothetical protein
MKTTKMLTFMVVALSMVCSRAEISEAAPMSMAFTYQGRLMDDNGPSDGLYDLQFTLYDDANTIIGNKVGSDTNRPDVDVIDGYFTVVLDFNDPNAFTGDARWLEVVVRPGDSNDANDFVALVPRQEVTPTPYALYAKTSGADNDWVVSGSSMYSIPGMVGIGTTTPRASFEVTNNGSSHAIWTSTSRIPVYALRTATSGTWPAVAGDCNSLVSGASGIRGRILSTSPGALSAGVYGFNYSTGSNGVGVRGHHDGSGTGVHGRAAGSTGTGVYGEADNSTGGLNYGGYFKAAGEWGNGVHGTTTGDTAHGVHGKATGLSGKGVYGEATNSSNFATNYGGYFKAEGRSGRGVHGQAKAYGGYFTASADNGIGIYAEGGAGVGGYAAYFVGTTRTNVLEIAGGSDLSERFEVSAEDVQVKPGMVVCIDPRKPGDLVVSKTTYDRTVAGIVSGAGGVKPGMLMGQEGTEAYGEHPVALTGRVYCRADASKSAIEPGDLLTTSDTPGHAMKVTDYNKSQGATLGKAMTSLKEGKGLVLVLVSLQ